LQNLNTDNVNHLITACIKGDTKAHYQIYKMYSKAMYNIAIRFVSNQQDAEDLLQEAFIKAFKNIRGFKGESSFGSWLKRIVINTCLDFVKKKEPVFTEFENQDVIDADEENGFYNVKSEVIHREIKLLPKGARTIISLYLLEGYKHKEIAEELDISESTSKSQYIRAKSLLLDRLKVHMNEN